MDQSVLSSRAIEGRYFARRDANLLNGWPGLVSNLFNSDQSSETYVNLGFAPAVREWIGGRQAKGLRGNVFTIANKHYEATLEIQVKDARRDKTGQIMARMEEFADQSDIHWATLLSSLIMAGDSTVCYDGQYFFDTDHSEGSSGSQANSVSYNVTTTTAPTKEEMQQAILTGITAIIGFKNDQGQPMNPAARSFIAMVPPGLYMMALAALSPVLNVALSNNMNPNALGAFNITPEMNPELTWTDKFAIFRADAPLKAIIRQEETPFDLKTKAEGSEFEFDNDAWQFGIDAWRNVGYGYWQRAALVTLT